MRLAGRECKITKIFLNFIHLEFGTHPLMVNIRIRSIRISSKHFPVTDQHWKKIVLFLWYLQYRTCVKFNYLTICFSVKYIRLGGRLRALVLEFAATKQSLKKSVFIPTRFKTSLTHLAKVVDAIDKVVPHNLIKVEYVSL